MTVYIKIYELSPDITAINFTGRLTLGDQLADVESAIRERIVQGLRKIVLDFTELNFIDSSGIGVIVVCIALMERVGGKLAVAGASGQVKQLLCADEPRSHGAVIPRPPVGSQVFIRIKLATTSVARLFGPRMLGTEAQDAVSATCRPKN